jgi:ElaA protein
MEWHIAPFESLSIHDLYRILQLRQQVFVVEQEAAYQDNDDADMESIHIWATSQNQTIAYARLIKPGIKYPEASIGRVCVHPDYRRQGLGHQLMSKALAYQKKHFTSQHNRISAQTYLIAFYRQYGFTIVGDLYFEDGLPHKEMLKLG